MKIKHFYLLVLLALSLSWSISTKAQSEDPFVVAEVDFMYVPEGMEGDYIAMEKEIAKPIHQTLVNEGKMDSWQLYRIPYPGGTNAEYHFATVRIYISREQFMQANNFGTTAERVHKGKDMDKMFARIMKTRDLVKTQRFVNWESFQAPDLKEAPKFLQMVYFKSDLGMIGKHMDLEEEIYIPMHKKEMEMGKRAGWQGWVLQRPMGSAQPYSHVAVDIYKDMAQAMAPRDSDALLKAVHPDKKWDDIDQQFTNATNLVNIEEWHLVDITAPKKN